MRLVGVREIYCITVHDHGRGDVVVPADVIDLSSNTNVLGPCRGAVEAVSREAGNANQYPDRQSEVLLKALANLHGVNANQILIGNGAHHVLRIAAQTFLAPGDLAVGLAPTYTGYRSATNVMRATFRSVPATDGGYDVARWVEAVAAARLVWLCIPNNPTGCTISHDDAKRIVEALPRHGLAVFDHAYRDFVDEPETAQGLAFLREGADVIVVHTFSKLYGLAGLRVGYALSKPEHIAAMLEPLDAFPVNRAGQAAAVAALQDGTHQDESRRYVLHGRRQLEAGLHRLGIQFFHSQANFVTAHFGDASTRVLQAVRNAGYLIRAMEGDWGLPGWLRITVGFEHHNADILRAIAGSLQEGST